MSNFSFIKSNLNKLGPDHLYRFLMDLITKGDFESIDDYDPTRIYHFGERVYVYEDNVHHIYECRVDNSTTGDIIDYEWVDLIDAFNTLNVDEILNKLYITEELFTADVDTREIPIKYDGYDKEFCKIMLYHSIQGRLASDEFTVNDNVITLKDFVMNKGEYIVMDIFEYNNKIHNTAVNPRGYVTVRFLDEEGNDIVKSVSYYGKLGDTFEVYPRYIEGYKYDRCVGDMKDIYDVDSKSVIFIYTKM